MIIAGQKQPTAKDAVRQLVQGQSQQVTVGMGQIEDPPPYFQSLPAESPAQLAVRPVPPVPRQSCSTTSLRSKAAKPATNHLFIKTRHEPVNGVFHIDPELETVALDKKGAAIDRRDFNLKHRQRHRHHGRKSFKKLSNLPDPNAIFETRQGAMALDISVVATPHSLNSRTLIQAATRQGPVDIKVHTIHPRRRLNMEISSRKGDICILIPRSFSGYIQLYSRHGQVVFLPHLSNSMTLVSRRERETQVVVGDAINTLPTKGTEWAGDTMHVAARHGDVFIGYVGEDRRPDAEPGFWKKLTDMFQKD